MAHLLQPSQIPMMWIFWYCSRPMPFFAESDVLILLHQARTKYQCDAYIVENTIELRSYWRGWFCFDRQERAKGIIQVML
jgi:hypothetical protein